MSAPLSFRLDDQLNEALEDYITKKGISKAFNGCRLSCYAW